jgi:hypothetical protein
MTLRELNGQYAQLRDAIDALVGAGGYSQARLARLMGELDRIDLELLAYRRRALYAPTLRDVVGRDAMLRPGQAGAERRPCGRG